MSILADPGKSQLLFIDPLKSNARQLECGLSEQLTKQFLCVSHAADLALVPRYFAVSRDEGSEDIWLSKPCEKNKPRVFEFERDRPVWSNEDLLDAMKRENRDQLFVCGFWLDDVVTAAALEAQPMGFNTHVITDLSIARSKSDNPAPASPKAMAVGANADQPVTFGLAKPRKARSPNPSPARLVKTMIDSAGCTICFLAAPRAPCRERQEGP